MVNCDAVPMVRAPAPVPQPVATKVRDHRARQIPSLYQRLFVVPPVPRGPFDPLRRRPAAAAPADRIMSACEFHQCSYATLNAGVSIKQLTESFTRIVDAHFHHRRGSPWQFATAFDLAQR